MHLNAIDGRQRREPRQAANERHEQRVLNIRSLIRDEAAARRGSTRLAGSQRKAQVQVPGFRCSSAHSLVRYRRAEALPTAYRLRAAPRSPVLISKK